jgi:hypothetical protein
MAGVAIKSGLIGRVVTRSPFPLVLIQRAGLSRVHAHAYIFTTPQNISVVNNVPSGINQLIAAQVRPKSTRYGRSIYERQ